MGADFTLHIFENITEEDLRIFNINTLGSKYFNLSLEIDEKKHMEVYDKISSLPGQIIGEVSWLKAAIFDDDKYIPDIVKEVDELIGEDLPIIDDDLIEKMKAIFETGNNNSNYDTVKWEKVEDFLLKYKGKRVFSVSW